MHWEIEDQGMVVVEAISSLRPCAFWGYEAIYSSVLGANNAYFNEMCH